ncbi:hypothetical protein O1611_g1681 [Lasiodiplodia mahajangana]|uniref:Uncharacterized protein n=1 Tax=Lasiodiplodia mahajangana TaxID=1108764 RepID=A0ACC2JXB1_9PEZI|nr:hypothetical protein O1611_g1681 [Lasiodiplodia mahajangana]
MTDSATAMSWHPSWLRRPILLAFTTFFISLGAGLVLMWYLVNRYDGIPLTLTTNHYVWTYGPTAIFTVVVSLWRQVNYCTMVNQPWHELHQSPQPAARTVLLDYMWPLQITSFIVALKNKHLAVAITISIFALLKIVMVISTTLFVLGYTSLSQDTHAQLLTKFDATNYLNSIRPGNHYIVTSDPVWDYLNLKEQYRDASPPLELSTAFTEYSIRPELPSGAGIASTQVDVFQVNVTCEIPTVEWSQDGPARSFNLSLKTPSCDIGTIQVAACNSEHSAFCAPTSSYFESGLVNCTGHGYAPVNIDDIRDTVNQYRLIITAIEGEVSLASDPETWPALFGVNVRRIAAVSCGIEYSIKQGIAQGSAFDNIDNNKIDSLHIIDGVGGKINNLTDPEVLAGIFISASYENTTTDSYSMVLIYNSGLDLLGLLAGSRVIEPDTFDSLLDVSLLRNRAEETLTGLSHQFMRRYFLVPDNTTTPSSINYMEQKLYLRQAALWAMVGLLATISCLSIAVVTHIKQGVAPHSPATLATVAYTISRSPTVVKILAKSGAMRLSEIRKTLDSYDFTTSRDRSGAPCVKAVAVFREKELPKPPRRLSRMWEVMRWNKTRKPEVPKPKEKSPWTPYSGRTHAIALTMILPITAIAVLEVLWYLSENVEHFITITSDSSIAAYAIRYGSTATVLIISTLFNSLDFAIATITPFSALAAGDAAPERTMFFSIVGDLPPVALYKSLSNMHFGAALSLIASTVGSLLTIAISGLWFDTAIEISRDITAEVQSDWNFTFMGDNIESAFQYISTDTINLFSDLEHGLPDEATLIWDNVVLPRVGNPQSSVTSQLKDTPGGGTPHYNIAVPAVRPFLECSILPSSAIAVSEFPSITLPIQRTFTATIILPVGCENVYAPADQARTESLRYDVSDHTSSGWMGQLDDLSVVLGPGRAPSAGCPSLGAMFGTYESLDPKTRQHRFNLTALTCTQRLQSVEANVTYPGDFSSLFAPNLTTDVHLNSPTPKNIIDVQSGISSLSALVGHAFGSIELSGLTDDTDAGFDTFFRLLVDGPQGTSRENLLGRKNSDIVIAAMNKLYQRFMVRVIDKEWRSSIGTGNTTRSIPSDGTAKGTMEMTVSRLKLSKTAKIILQAFLGTMVVFGGLAWRCVDLRVLPRNPYPIASSMALFAGSRLIGAPSPELSDISGQVPPRLIKRKPLVIIKGRKFRLGWWETRRMETDDVRESDPASQSPTETKWFGIDFEVDDITIPSTPSKTNNLFRRRFK